MALTAEKEKCEQLQARVFVLEEEVRTTGIRVRGQGREVGRGVGWGNGSNVSVGRLGKAGESVSQTNVSDCCGKIRTCTSRCLKALALVGSNNPATFGIIFSSPYK